MACEKISLRGATALRIDLHIVLLVEVCFDLESFLLLVPLPLLHLSTTSRSEAKSVS